MKTNGNDYAHSSGHKDPNGGGFFIEGGLTKREYFAVKAPMEQLVKMYFDRECATFEQCANLAVQYADALIEALNKEPGVINE